jgi:hypothetical protein
MRRHGNIQRPYLKIESKPSRSLVPFTSITSTRGLGDRARYDGTLLFQREVGIRERLSAGKTATRRHVNINQQITTALQNLFRDQMDTTRSRCYGFANTVIIAVFGRSGLRHHGRLARHMQHMQRARRSRLPRSSIIHGYAHVYVPAHAADRVVMSHPNSVYISPATLLPSAG